MSTNGVTVKNMSNIEVKVKDVMKTHVDIFDGMKTVQEALTEMNHVDTKTLIIEKRHSEDEWGVVSISDIARKVLAKNLSPERTNIYEIMTKPVITVHKEMNIRYCAQLFDKFKLSRAPVVHDNQIIGIVSYTDMVLKGMVAK